MSMHVSIYRERWNAGINIMIWEDRNGTNYVAKPVELVFEEAPKFSAVSPTLRFSSDCAPAFMKALAEALDGEGIKTDSDAKLSGTLEAQKYHLEDLRLMLKLPIVVKDK